MKIVSLVLKYFPARAAEVRAGVEAVAGASVAHDHGDGRMIVLIEDGEDYAVSDSIIKVHQVPDIMSVTLAYEYSDDALALEEV
jgi:periplasmic nitrate reductase NapD